MTDNYEQWLTCLIADEPSAEPQPNGVSTQESSKHQSESETLYACSGDALNEGIVEHGGVSLPLSFFP